MSNSITGGLGGVSYHSVGLSSLTDALRENPTIWVEVSLESLPQMDIEQVCVQALVSADLESNVGDVSIETTTSFLQAVASQSTFRYREESLAERGILHPWLGMYVTRQAVFARVRTGMSKDDWRVEVTSADVSYNGEANDGEHQREQRKAFVENARKRLEE